MGPGDFFGEGGVVSAQPRGESVRAATPLKVREGNLSFSSVCVLLRSLLGLIRNIDTHCEVVALEMDSIKSTSTAC